MGRKRRGIPIHGWLIIDKPLGLTSNQVVGRVRRLTNAAKVGHGGTLDPLASGILPLALGEATKTVSYVMDGTKVYHFTVRWGIERSTDDAEGEIIATEDKRPTKDEIHQALKQFIGTIDQVPPKYSAVKIDGQRAYALARADQEVTLQSRQIRVDRFELLEMVDDDHATFEVESGKGAYMRSLGRDLARAMGTVGHISELRRISVGGFSEKDAISLDKLEELGHSAALEDYLLAVETALDDIPALALTEAEARRLRNGQPVSLLAVARRSPQNAVPQGATVCAMEDGKPVALARVEGGEVRPVRVLNL
ncbi:tRNA pseudouridine(55) synthase TruB [Magnetospira sp. QH-2]|uniref:tRNA pseudouridine(55) synthase TruB n=1 Tax=Magnetospira sp. (strain QH-2) TaxID=1288970 RepID=UPI0003E81007|nr:tRNA pseudouridine(55) synthase TruB [Magnetospira sp. QH-2]CCQ75721.1 tRNA pseudouridine synthase [Magnetospira sp. QH-2]